jgi:hypothetical protein
VLEHEIDERIDHEDPTTSSAGRWRG